jgi:hypothetical protein
MKQLRIFTVVFALLMVYSVTPQPSYAAGLTQSQISSILNLLIAFGADQSIINNVAHDLGGTTSSGAGSLLISVAATPASQTIVAGSIVTAANIQLDASGSSEDVRVNGLGALYTDNIAVDPMGCQVFNGTTALTTGVNVVNPSGTGIKTFVFDSSLIVPRGTVKILTIRCLVSSSAANGTFNWGVQAGAVSLAVGVSTGQTIFPVAITNGGPTMSLTQSGGGSLSVSNYGGVSTTQVAAGGTSGVMLGAFRLHAGAESVLVQKMSVFIDDYRFSPSDISQAYIYDGSTMVGRAIFSTNNVRPAGYYSVVSLDQNITVPANSDKYITIRGDLAAIGVGKPGHSGHDIQVGIGEVSGYGVSSGSVIATNPNDGTPFSSTNTIIYRSFPSLSLVSLPSTGLSDGKLLRFKVTANTAGDISLGEVTIRMNGLASNANGQADLYAYTDPSFSLPAANTPNPSGAINGAAISYASNGAYLWFPYPVVIPAGMTYYFELRDSTKGSGFPTNSALSTTLLAASAPLDGAVPATSLMGKDAVFVWSPNSNTTSTFSDTDWFLGFGLPGFPAEGLTQVRTGSSPVTPTPAAASIDYGSLTSTTGNPTISGSAYGTFSNFGISIDNGDKEYGSGNIPVVGTRWSVTVSPALPSGTHNVVVYGDNVALARGVLTIVKPTTTTPPVCSPVPAVDCASGYHLEKQANNAYGCAVADKCVANPVTTPTPTPTTAAAEVRAIGVYQGTGGVSDFCHSTPGTVTVTVPKNTAPIILALSAYEPVKWVLHVDPGTTIKKIILSGYNAQTVSGQAAGVAVENHFYNDYARYTQGSATYSSNSGSFYNDQASMPATIFDWAGDASCAATSAAIVNTHRRYFNGSSDYFYAYANGSSEYTNLANKLQALTGLPVTSFQGAYAGSSFTLTTKVSQLRDTMSTLVRAVSLVNSGMAAVMDAYLNLFGLAL